MTWHVYTTTSIVGTKSRVEPAANRLDPARHIKIREKY